MQALTPATFPYLYTRFTYPPSLCLRRLARPLVHPLFSHSCNRAFIFLTIRGAILPLVYGLGTDISLEIIKWRDASSLSLSLFFLLFSLLLLHQSRESSRNHRNRRERSETLLHSSG